MKNYNKVIAAVVAGIVCSAVTSHAALATINQGTGVPALNVGLTGVPLTGIGGGTLFDTLTSNYSFAGNTGTIVSSVYTGDANNPLGGLTFIYALTVSTGDIATVALNDFGSLAKVAVGWGTSSGGIISAENFTSSGVVNFSFQDSITNGLGTQYLVVGTAATTDEVGGTGFTDGGVFPTLTPILVPVPEPATVVAGALLLLPLGIGAVRSLRKERVV
jgi:hypothetical protein